MSKSPPGMPVGPKITFAARGYSVMLMPMSLSSDLTIASLFVRTALPDVHDQRNVAGKPEHVHVPPAPGEDGPPVLPDHAQRAHCFASVACGTARSRTRARHAARQDLLRRPRRP